MLNLKVARRVIVFSSDRGVDVVPSQRALDGLERKLYTIRHRDKKHGVTAVDIALIGRLDAKPGAFGAHEEHLPSGHTCWAHLPTWEKALSYAGRRA